MGKVIAALAVILILLARPALALTEDEFFAFVAGDWQSQGTPMALSVNAEDRTATYVMFGIVTEGPIVVDRIIANSSVELRIANSPFVAHPRGDRLHFGAAGDVTLSMTRVD